MPKKSAGILLYRINKFLEVFLVHPGGPFFKNRDQGVWSIPKGEFYDDEKPLDCAKREFEEETGSEIDGHFIELNPVTQKNGKLVYCWAVEGTIDETGVKSNNFQLEWPPKSGKFREFPEVDKGAWFSVSEAKKKMNERQFDFVEQLMRLIDGNPHKLTN